MEVYNPWRESLENCISGDNYLRASEYRSLIEELDDLYRLRAAPPALPEGAVEAMRGAVEALRGLSLFVGVYEGRTLDKPRAEAMLRKADAALRAQLAQIGGVR
ncbi:MAG: hypothetical protein EHM87_24165 [Burkholderiales bacterium]|nr:MAG: hypothetical protein EHM87_24165 [Burkholderiales bacterium]